MMTGIDRKRHNVLLERFRQMEELLARNLDDKLHDKHWELEKSIHLLSEKITRYNALMKELAAIVESYSKLYNDTSMSANQILRKAKAKIRKRI